MSVTELPHIVLEEIPPNWFGWNLYMDKLTSDIHVDIDLGGKSSDMSNLYFAKYWIHENLINTAWFSPRKNKMPNKHEHCHVIIIPWGFNDADCSGSE